MSCAPRVAWRGSRAVGCTPCVALCGSRRVGCVLARNVLDVAISARLGALIGFVTIAVGSLLPSPRARASSLTYCRGEARVISLTYIPTGDHRAALGGTRIFPIHHCHEKHKKLRASAEIVRAPLGARTCPTARNVLVFFVANRVRSLSTALPRRVPSRPSRFNSGQPVTFQPAT